MKHLIATAVLSACSMAYANTHISNYNTDSHLYEFTQTYDLIAPKGSQGQANLWVPLPFNGEYQQVKSIHFEGNYLDAYVTENNKYGAKTLFATWDKETQKRDLKVTMVIETKDREPMAKGALDNYKPPKDIQYSVDVQEYLKPTQHIKTDGIVKQFADKIVGTETNPLKKAELIHQWIVGNMERDNSVLGCGDGDVEKILTTGVLKGKCTDINSVFVALARAAGIPGFGWVPVDSADVAKMRLAEKKSVEDKDTQAVAKYLFGNWENNWVGFNHARDFDLYPKPELAPINNFGYPYAEVGGDPLNSFEPKEFKYDYVSKKLQ